METKNENSKEIFGPRPKCPNCRVPAVLRCNKSTGEYFWGCQNFPKCKLSTYIKVAYRITDEDWDAIKKYRRNHLE